MTVRFEIIHNQSSYVFLQSKLHESQQTDQQGKQPTKNL